MGNINFKVRMRVAYFFKGEDGYKTEYATKKFVLHTYDDLQNLLLTLIESSEDTLDVSIDKEEVDN